MPRLPTNYCGVNLLCCHSLRKLNVAPLRLASSLVCAVHLDLLATFLSSLVLLTGFVHELVTS